MQIPNQIKALFVKPTAQTIAQRQLEDAQRQLLVYQSQTEYSQQMVKYYQTAITRLSAYVRTKEEGRDD
jgi:hypothetical protein